MSEKVIIGHLDWSGCDECKHSDYYKGCLLEDKYHGTWPATLDGDFVYCDVAESEADDE